MPIVRARSSMMRRREGQVPIAPMVRVQQKARGRTTGTSRTSRPSLREWLYGLYVLSPGTGVLAPVARVLIKKQSQAWPQHREARTTRFRRPRHVVRPHVKHTLRHAAAIAFPVQRSWRRAYVPHPDRNARSIRLILWFSEAIYFRGRAWNERCHWSGSWNELFGAGEFGQAKPWSAAQGTVARTRPKRISGRYA